jgi:hypothetical protein
MGDSALIGAVYLVLRPSPEPAVAARRVRQLIPFPT